MDGIGNYSTHNFHGRAMMDEAALASIVRSIDEESIFIRQTLQVLGGVGLVLIVALAWQFTR
jgi:hypothetical protein